MRAWRICGALALTSGVVFLGLMLRIAVHGAVALPIHRGGDGLAVAFFFGAFAGGIATFVLKEVDP